MPNSQSSTEFTYAPGEKDIIGESFSPNILLAWLKTSIAVSNTRVQYRTPNTILGIIPLGEERKTIPLNNVAAVNTNQKFNMGNFIIGLIFAIVGLGTISNSATLLSLIAIVIGIACLCNTLTMSLNFDNQAGGTNSVTVSILEKDKLAEFSKHVEQRIFANSAEIRHREAMSLQQQQFSAQATQTLLQQQMLAAAQANNNQINQIQHQDQEQPKVQE